MKIEQIAKVILFGEYLVLLGADILSLPVEDKKGILASEGKGNSFWEGYYQYLVDRSKDLNQDFDTDQLKSDIKNGLSFSTNFLPRAGLGSSGALVAGLYKHYTPNKIKDTTQLLEDFGIMESYFHGTSSGFDPLVSYLNKAILRQGDKVSVLDKIPKIAFEIIDSGEPRRDPNMVEDFLKRVGESTDYRNDMEQLTMLNNAIIKGIIDQKDMKSQISTFCSEQQRLMPDYFTEGLREQANTKLCGAGGGGYFLQFDIPSS